MTLDLFEALVRLEAAGWTAGPAAPADDAATEVARLLRKASWLEPPDGSGRYTFHALSRGTAEARAAESPGGAVHWAVDGGRVHVWAVRPDGEVDYLGASLGAWLEGLVEELDSADPIPPVPVVELGHEGTGWGWRLEDLDPPDRLDMAQLEAEVGSRLLSFSDGIAWAGQRVQDVVPKVAEADAPSDEPDLGDLFGEGGGRPRPRTGLIGTLLVVGLALTVIGMACISAPGGLLVLLAWYFVEKDAERVESGYLPESERARVEVIRRFTYAGLLIVVVLFAVQGFLLCNGAYDVLLDEVYIPLWQRLVMRLLGSDDLDPGFLP